MTHTELNLIKQRQMEIMDEIHRICEKNAIKYYMIAGTLLGAVRHKGFIPWDVDIDIAMPREEYARFKEVCMQELCEDYYYCDYQNVKYYLCPHARICDKKSSVMAKYDHVNPIRATHGIYIDVFPLDNAPDDEKLRERQARKLKKLRILKEKRMPYSYSLNRWKRMIHYGRSMLLFWIPARGLNQYQQKCMQKYSSFQTECLCSMASQYTYAKQCMPREIYGRPTLLEFEGRHYYAPEKYTEYLTRLYGDYMQLPPENKRRANMELYRTVEFF